MTNPTQIDRDHAVALIVKVYADNAARALALLGDDLDMAPASIHDIVGDTLADMAEGG